MRNKVLLITTIVLAVGAGAVILSENAAKKAPDERLGTMILSSDAGTSADAITIVKGDKELKLVRDDGGVWHLGEKAGFPASAPAVMQLVDQLARVKPTMVVSTKEGKRGDFGLTTPTKLTIASKGQTKLALELGDHRQAGGQYAALNGEPKTYLLDQAVNASPDAEVWELKTILDIAKEKVRSVSFFAEEGAAPVTVSREKPEDPMKVAGLAEPQKEKPAVKAVDGILSGVTFSKRLDPSNAEAQAAFAKPGKAFVTLFDGRQLEVQVGSVGSKWFLRVMADGEGDAEIARIKQLMTQHAFEVPQHVAQRFVKKQDEFVEVTAGG